MKTVNVKWGRGKREVTGNKSKCKRWVCDIYLDRFWFFFSGNGVRNISVTVTKDFLIASEIGTSTGEYLVWFFCYGYVLRDFLGKYVKDFFRGFWVLRWYFFEAERVM